MVGLYGSRLEHYSIEQVQRMLQDERIPAHTVASFLSLIQTTHQRFALDVDKAISLLKNSSSEQLASVLRVSKIKFPGTDGMRGLVSLPEVVTPVDCLVRYCSENQLTPLFCFVMVRAFLEQVKTVLHPLEMRICLGEDGRDAAVGHSLLPALLGALSAAGWAVDYLGVVPTPAVAAYSLDQQIPGIMLTASHNPASYNGLKFFVRGKKLYPEGPMGEYALSAQALAVVSSLGETFQMCPAAVPPVNTQGLQLLTECVATDLSEEEKRFLASCSITLDCAHGAVSSWYQMLLQNLGLFAEVLNVGLSEGSINNGCGAALLDGITSIRREGPYPLALAKRMVEKQSLDNTRQFGIAVDGDGDRAIVLVLEPESDTVRVLSGDELLVLLVRRLQDAGRTESGVSLTIESDPHTMQTLKRLYPDLTIRQTGVGDRWLFDNALLCGAEDSGHVVYPVSVGEHLLYSGNGLATGLSAIAAYRPQLLEHLCRTGVQKVVVKPVATQFWYVGSVLFEQVRNILLEVFAQDIEPVVCEEDADILAYRLYGRELLYARASGTEPKLQFVHPDLDDDRFEKASQAFRIACKPFQK